MKTGLVNYKISEHGAGLGVVVKRARISHVCDECSAAITPKTVYIEHPIRFGAPMKLHVACAVKLELAEPLQYVDHRGNPPQYQQAVTPGPWKVTGSRDDDEGLFIVQEKTGGVIAHIESTTGYGPADELNAKLIAASVELLQACKAVQLACKGGDWADAISLSAAAIAKAEGR
jgi:hypothetical protein